MREHISGFRDGVMTESGLLGGFGGSQNGADVMHGVPPPTAVVPRACGAPSTPRPFGSIIDASGILDHPPSRMMTVESVTRSHNRHCEEPLRRSNPACFAKEAGLLRFARNDEHPHSRGTMRPSFSFSSAQRGRGECRAPNAPAASRAKIKKHTSIVTTGSPEIPSIPARNGFNSLLRALPGEPRSFATVAGGYYRQLDTGVRVSGPHDFAVREWRPRPGTIRVHRIPRPTFVTIANAPFGWVGTANSINPNFDLVKLISEIRKLIGVQAQIAPKAHLGFGSV
jgi:hypothetical protein